MNQKIRRQESVVTSKKYADPILCPVCDKVFGEWVEVSGTVTIEKWCPKCKEFRFITKKGLISLKKRATIDRKQPAPQACVDFKRKHPEMY